MFVTALYTLPPAVLTFHGPERFHDERRSATCARSGFDASTKPTRARHEHDHAHGHDDHAHEPHEAPWVVTVPLILLAIPSVADRLPHDRPDAVRRTASAASIVVHRRRRTRRMRASWPRSSTAPLALALHGFIAPPFWLALAGVVAGVVPVPGGSRSCRPRSRARFRAARTAARATSTTSTGSTRTCFAGGGVALGTACGRAATWRSSTARRQRLARVRRLAVGASCAACRSGYLYHYAFAMIIGLIAAPGGCWSSATCSGR